MSEMVDRMPEFIGLPTGTDPRAILTATAVVVIGVGSVGARTALHLARCGVGRLTLVDGKRFGANFATQATRSRADVGRPKATRVGRWAKAIHPQTDVRAWDAPLEAVPWSALIGHHAAIASTDNLPAEVEAGRRCLALGLPLILAAVHGASLTTQVRTFTNRGPESPCPACGFNAIEWDQMNGSVRFSCDPGGERKAHIVAPHTASVSPLCSLAADQAVLELLKLRLGIGAGFDDRVRQYNAYTHEASDLRLTRNHNCPVDHTVLDRAAADRPLAECTLGDCARAAGIHADGDVQRTSFELDGAIFAERVVCPDCGFERPHDRFIRRGARLRRRCPACGCRGMVAHPFYSRDRLVPGSAGPRDLGDAPLRALGAAAACVIVRGPERAALVVHEAAEGGTST